MAFKMKQYRIRLFDNMGNLQYDHIDAETSQEAADQMRKDWPGCLIVTISEVVHDWE